MYRIKTIEDSLLNVVGWQQAHNPAKAIDAVLTKSESGLYFQGAHPLMTLDNVREIMPEDYGLQYPEWDGATMYHAGAKVQKGGVFYKALRDNTGIDPAAADMPDTPKPAKLFAINFSGGNVSIDGWFLQQQKGTVVIENASSEQVASVNNTATDTIDYSYSLTGIDTGREDNAILSNGVVWPAQVWKKGLCLFYGSDSGYHIYLRNLDNSKSYRIVLLSAMAYQDGRYITYYKIGTGPLTPVKPEIPKNGEILGGRNADDLSVVFEDVKPTGGVIDILVQGAPTSGSNTCICSGIYVETTPDAPAPSEDEAWERYDILSGYLEDITRTGIAQVVQTFVGRKQLQQETRTLMERRTFFDGAGRLAHTTDNAHKIVGFEIVGARTMGVTVRVERVGLQFVGGTGTVRLYLFHSSQPEPLKVYDLEYTARNGGFQWFALEDCYLPYMGAETSAGGAWYLCYNQDELPAGMEAVNVSKDWSREPCGTCNIGSVEAYREISRYMQVSPFMVGAPATFAETPQLWDIALNIYTNTLNYGLNCEVSAGCDLTEFIVSQRAIFAPVIQKQVAATALRTMIMNPNTRVNRHQSNVSRMDMLYEIDGNTQGPRPNGLGYELRKAYEAIDIDTRGLDSLCLACNNKGVRYRGI